MSLRNLVLVLGDQLDLQSPAFVGFDAAQDLVWMAELPEESEHVWSHKARTALFLSAMRHFGRALEVRALPLRYLRIGDHPYAGFSDASRGPIRQPPACGTAVAELSSPRRRTAHRDPAPCRHHQASARIFRGIKTSQHRRFPCQAYGSRPPRASGNHCPAFSKRNVHKSSVKIALSTSNVDIFFRFYHCLFLDIDYL